MNTSLSIIRCADYAPAAVQQAVRKAVDLLGGVRQFIRPGSKVLVKPNLLMAKEPQFGVTTHPEVVRSAIRLLKEINCRVIVGDGPSVWGGYIENVDSVYRVTGIEKVCQEEGAQLVKFDKRRMRAKFPLTTWVDECDQILNLPKFKTHDFTLLTAGIKNLFGLVPGTFKTELHKNYFDREDFARILVDIYEEAKPALTIIDGIVAMEGDGPGTGGKLRSMGLVLAGQDCVALDSVLALIMGVRQFDVLSTKNAAMRGLGVADINSITIMGEKLENVAADKFILPTTSFSAHIPKPVLNLAKKLIKYYPCVERDNCLRCSACIQACPNKAITLKKRGITFDYKKCIACFCCQEVCPEAAIKIKRSLLAKIIRL
jgi:uncharacterized protein (DUF362 family)/Pyruvate/2-oxoacid:ferredoxin oxidoreductase delta subunit